MTVVDIDSGAEENIVATSQGSATGLNLKEKQKIYFGGLPTIGNYRYTFISAFRHSKLSEALHVFEDEDKFLIYVCLCFS